MRLSKQERYRLMKISLLDSSIVLCLCFVFDFLFYKFGYHYFKHSITDLYLANTSIVVVLVGLLALRSWKTIESLWDKQKRLIESERRYRGVVESQQDLVVRVNSEGKLTFVNEAYCHVFGKTSDELLTQSFHPMVHEDDLPQTLALDTLDITCRHIVDNGVSCNVCRSILNGNFMTQRPDNNTEFNFVINFV
jgi:PAS domain-containing protein